MRVGLGRKFEKLEYDYAHNFWSHIGGGPSAELGVYDVKVLEMNEDMMEEVVEGQCSYHRDVYVDCPIS